MYTVQPRAPWLCMNVLSHFGSIPSQASAACLVAPNRSQWMGLIEGATHIDFAGAGFAAASVEAQVTRITSAFLTSVRASSCSGPPAEKRVILRVG